MLEIEQRRVDFILVGFASVAAHERVDAGIVDEEFELALLKPERADRDILFSDPEISVLHLSRVRCRHCAPPPLISHGQPARNRNSPAAGILPTRYLPAQAARRGVS